MIFAHHLHRHPYSYLLLCVNKEAGIEDLVWGGGKQLYLNMNNFCISGRKIMEAMETEIEHLESSRMTRFILLYTLKLFFPYAQ